MQPVLIGMAVCVLTAIAVLVAVAIPRLLSGARVLTPVGRRLVLGVARAWRTVAGHARRHAGRAGTSGARAARRTVEALRTPSRRGRSGPVRPSTAQLHPAGVNGQRSSAVPVSIEDPTSVVDVRATEALAVSSVAVSGRLALATRPRTSPAGLQSSARLQVLRLRPPLQPTPDAASAPPRKPGGLGEPKIGPRHRR